MPVEEEILDATVRTYVQTMPSIRGPRVHPALLALGKGGSVSVCQTDGRGAAVAVAEHEVPAQGLPADR